MSNRRWPWFNYCMDCGARIPWRKRAFFGNRYKPVVCAVHGYTDRVALRHAAAEFLAEHPEMAKYVRELE